MAEATNEPLPLILAHEIAPALANMDWGIGGSLLLWKLGLEDRPRDFDIMTTAAHFQAVSQLIAQKLGQGVRTPHATSHSTHFARFDSKGTVSLDLFAEVRVKKSGELVSWTFDPRSIEISRGLPWMLPKSWLELYELFDRPERAKALRAYLAKNSP